MNIIDIIWSKNYAFKQLKYDAVFLLTKNMIHIIDK